MSEEGDSEELVKVLVDLPNHWATGGESLWAKSLGNNAFELRNTPFYAYGLNWGDIVEAIEEDRDSKPLVRRVIRESGNRTLRLFFAETVDRDTQVQYLDQMTELGLSYERATASLVAIDIHPGSDYGAVCDHLWHLEQKEILQYETCEGRAEARFDDGPRDEEEPIGEYEN